MKLLQAKILENERQSQQQSQSDLRRGQVGTGDRSGRIRTYNFPQGRVTDHRIQTSWQQITDIIDGDLHPVIEALQQDDYTQRLSMLKDE